MTAEFDPQECLTALTSKPKRRRFLVYDIESKDGDSQRPGFTRPFLCGVHDGTKFQSFVNENREDLHPWDERPIAEGGCIDRMMRAVLVRKHRGKYIYAHNGGSFDHLHILPWLTRHIDEFSYVIVPVQSSIQVLKVTSRSTKHTWTFLDSMKLLPMSLDRAAKSFGFEGKLEHDLEKHESDPSWWEYLERDCSALQESVAQAQHLILDRLGGEMGITAPSTAMKLFRRKYMGKGLSPAMIPQHRHWKRCEDSSCTGCLHAWIRTGYHGGRTEVRLAKAKRQTYYDVNSSYPASMLEEMPGGELRTFAQKPIAFLDRLAKKYIGFIECEVSIPKACKLPPLPYHDPESKKLLFPVGRFRGVWTHAELQLLKHPLVKGKITRVIKSAWYERKTLFFDYVQELYSYRNKDSKLYDEGLAELAKLLMNALYGKFGMNEERREIVVLKPGEEPPEGAVPPAFENGEENLLARVFYVEKRVSPPYIAPQISAYITSLARIRLFHGMATVITLGGEVAYVDTDSIICDRDDLPTSNKLGDWKNVYPGEHLNVEAVGPKMYLISKRKAFKGEHKQTCKEQKSGKCAGCLRKKVAAKGIPKQMRNEKTLQKLINGETISFRRLEKLGAMSRTSFANPPKMVRVTKSLQNKFGKRIMMSDGTTRPHVMALSKETLRNENA